MIGQQKSKDEGFVTVATKVPVEMAELLQVLARQRGMEVYELLQMLVNGFVSAAKHTGPVTPQIRLLLESLKADAAYCRAFNFASPTAQAEIAQMVLVLQQPGKRGLGAVMIDRPFMDTAQQTYSVDAILERMAEVTMPTMYRQLRQVGISLDSQSLRETLIIMCDAQMLLQFDDDFQAELPQMGNYSDYGRAIEYGRRTRSHHHRTPDGEAHRQQRILFTDDDRRLADSEAGHDQDKQTDESDFRPFGVEW